MRTWVQVDDGGHLTWAKAPSSVADGVRLRHEAELLGRIRHPNVVELLESNDDGIVLRFVGRASLAERPPATRRDVADVIAALAAVLDELHRAGIAHGAVRAEHCVLAPDGRLVLA